MQLDVTEVDMEYCRNIGKVPNPDKVLGWGWRKKDMMVGFMCQFDWAKGCLGVSGKD
jgi:hypothetical protein